MEVADLDFSKQKKLKIKLLNPETGSEEVVSLRYPKVKDQKELLKKTKALKEDDAAAADVALQFLEELGLPQKFSEELEQAQVTQIINVLTGNTGKK